MSSMGVCSFSHSSMATDTVRRYQPDSRHGVPLRTRASRGLAESNEYCKTSEAELLRRAQAGDQHAFSELCTRHSRSVRGRIFRIVKNHEDADDIVQETLMRAYMHLSGFRGNCSFQTWMTQIAINTALMLLRRRKTSSERCGGFVGNEGEILDFPDATDPGPNPEQIYSRAQSRSIVLHEISKLPAGFRHLIILYYGEEGSLTDAARTLGLTLAAAKSRLLRARALLRRRLGYHAFIRK